MPKKDLATLNITVLPELCSHTYFLNELSCSDDVVTDEKEYEYKLAIYLSILRLLLPMLSLLDDVAT